MNFPHRIVGRLAAASLLVVLLTGASAASAGVLYEGALPGQELTWRAGPDGAMILAQPGSRALQAAGGPEVLMRPLTVLVPAGAAIGGVEIVPLATRRVRLPAPLRLATPALSDEGRPGREVAPPAGDGVFPTVWGEAGGTQSLRGFRLLPVTVYPVRVLVGPDGAWTELEILERFAIRSTDDAAAPAPDFARRLRSVPGERARTERLLRSICANPEALATYARDDGAIVPSAPRTFAPTRVPSIDGSAVSYLIITNDELSAEFQRLADHRTAMGLPAVVRSVEWIRDNYRNGVDIQETMRSFIREAYERWGVEYVLLGGDTDVLPARYVFNSYYPSMVGSDLPVDLYFNCLDGNWNGNGNDVFGEQYEIIQGGDGVDLVPELYLGRAPVSTPEDAASFVDKVIAYEEQPAGSQFANRFLFAAEVLFWKDDLETEPWSDGATFAQAMVDSLLDPLTDMENVRMFESWDGIDAGSGLPLYPGAVPETRLALMDSLSTGHYSYLNQIGHGMYFNMSVGDANLFVGDADALTNDGRPFLLYALNCASAAFDFSCLMERFVQNRHGGSVASIGAVRAAFPNVANLYQYDFFRQLFEGGSDRLGELLELSRLPWLGSTGTDNIFRWSTMNVVLLGDPALRLWTGAPAGLDVAAPASLSTGEQPVAVTVSAGGSPVPGALVTLAVDGDAYVKGVTDGLGEVTLDFTPSFPGQARLTVNGHDLAPAGLDIPVSAGGGSFIAMTDVAVVDDGSLGSVGNGNGRIESGEMVALLGTFTDTGSGGGTGLTAALSTTAPGIVVVDGAVAVPAVPSGVSAAATDPFLVAVAASVADGVNVGFTVHVTDGGGRDDASLWTTTMLAPELEPVDLAWTDAGTGDGDGVLENGETVTFTVSLQNYGAGDSDGVVGRVRTSTPGVAIQDSLLTFAGIPALSTGDPEAAASLSVADVAAGYDCWILFEDDQGRSFRHDFDLGAPEVPGSLTVDSSLGPDVLGVHWLPTGEPDLRGYHIYRAEVSAGPYLRMNQDLIEGTSYFRDEGLGLLTRYYYKISAVDSSLVEGPLSAAILGITAPPELIDFPLPVGAETSGPLAVGDVDADGDLDMVIGADEVYVLDAQGNELFDGDDNTQTLGPITDIGGSFNPAAILLADLDGQPGLEIVATETSQRKIHIFRQDGTEMPGWPQTVLVAWNWATPALGDIDGDDELELVLQNLYGWVYGWNLDGTEVADGDANPATNGPLIVRPEATWEWGYSSPALFDLDGDGAAEIIFGSKLGCPNPNYVYAFRPDGTQPSGWPFATGYCGSVLASPTVADLDNDGQHEVIFNTETDSLYVVRQDGSRYPGFPVPCQGNVSPLGSPAPSPAIGDFDGDGQFEIIAVDVYDGHTGLVRLVDTDIAGGTSGQTMSGWPVFVPGSSQASPVVADIDGDGSLDVVFPIGGDSTQSEDLLVALRADGTAVDGFPISLDGPGRGTPTLCDFDDDGDIDIVYAGWERQIHVWDLPAPYDPALAPWPTFRGSTLRDGVYHGPSLTDVPGASTPSRLLLAPNHPNPFNPSTTIRLYLPGGGAPVSLRLGVYDLQGRRVRDLFSGELPSGWHEWIWDGRDDGGRRQASGVYFLHARGGGETRTGKMLLVK